MNGEEFLEHGAIVDEIAALFPEVAQYGGRDDGTFGPIGINLSSALFTLWSAWQEDSKDLKERLDAAGL